VAAPFPPGLKQAALWRVALVAAIFAAGVAVYRGEEMARREHGWRMPYPMWQEMVRQQLIQPDLTMRMSLFAEQLQRRLHMPLSPPLDPEYLYERAVARYEMLVLDPTNDNPYARYRLGIIYALRGYTEQAQPLFMDAARRDVDNEATYLALARLFSPHPDLDHDLEGVLPHLETLPTWLGHLTIPHYYARVEDDTAPSSGSRTLHARSAPPPNPRLEAERRAATHHFGFGLRALLLGLVVAVLLLVSLGVILAAIWRGAFGPARGAALSRARVPWHVPWSLIDTAEVLAVLLLALVAVGLAAGLAADRLQQDITGPTARAAIVAAQYLLVMLIALRLMLWRVRAPQRQKLSVLGLRNGNRLGSLIYTGVAGYSIYLLIALVQSTMSQSLPLACTASMQLGMRLLEQQDAMSVVLYLALLGLLAPLAEELIFRGFVYGGIRRYLPAFTAVLVSAGIFGLMHLNSMALLQLVVIGIILAVLYERTRSLIPCIVCHALNNVLVFVTILLVNY
jgi:membrane protease YdiL (CAAX protease family)